MLEVGIKAPDFEGKKHIGELVGDYLRANFPDIVNN